MKEKFIRIVIVCFYVVTICTACGKKESIKNSENKTDNSISFKYDELSDVSGLTYNNTANLTAEYTSVKLYQWAEGINMPVEKPKGAKLEKNTDELIRFSGVTKDVWRAYCDELEKNYKVVSVVERGETGDPYGCISICSPEENWMMSFNWLERSLDGECSGELKIILSMDNQETSAYENKKILDEAAKVIGLDVKKSFVRNISTHSNLANEFEVFYIDTFNDFSIPYDMEGGEERPFMYLCVMYNGKMVYFKENVVHSYRGFYYDIEFIRDFNDIEMFILTQTTPISGIGKDEFDSFKVDVYKLNDDKFIFDRTYSLNNYAEFKDKVVTLKRNGNEIEIYEVDINTGTDVLYTNVYSLGKKLGVLK